MTASMDVQQLNAYLERYPYLGDERLATLFDYELCAKMDANTIAEFPHLLRWHTHISALSCRYGTTCDPYGHPIPKGVAPQASSGSARKANATGTATKPQANVAGLATKSDTASVGPKFFCVLDFEKTCQDRDVDAQWGPQEIIEFPSVLVGREGAQIVGEFQSFVKPQVNPTLTPFCLELVQIPQATVDGAKCLPEVLAEHHSWLRSLVPAESDCIFVTCGDMDLKTSLPMDPNVPADVPGCYKKWINIKKDFAVFYTQWYKKGKQAKNMLDMLEKLELPLDGQHHSGLDDSRNIAKVVQRMLSEGWKPNV